MKKNLLTMITFALVVVNLVLTAILAITIVPEVQKVNSLVTTISNAIDLDLQAAANADSSESIGLENIEVQEIPETLTINLKPGEDGKIHYAIVGVTLSINTTSEAYATYGGENFQQWISIIKSTINRVCIQYTFNEFQTEQNTILRNLKEELNAQFGDGFVANVGFSSVTLN